MKKITTLITALFTVGALFAQTNKNNETEVIPCSEFHITRPLRDIMAENPVDENKVYKKSESEDRENRTPQKFPLTVANGPQYGNDPSSVQDKMGSIPGRAPIQNWAGQTAAGFRPFDPSGAVGPNHYVQMINSTTFKVYNKTTGATMLTATLGNLWTPATPNDGDPIVMYDKAADRWFLSQFGQTGNKIYIAISTTNDPTGAYYTYTYTSPQFPDYLKFSVWQDGYYMTSNQTQRVFAFERTAMLAGVATARSVTTAFSPPQSGGFFVPMPGDAEDGVLPPAGTPCPIFSYSDNGWGGGFTDAVNIFKMAVTWGATPTGTITSAGVIPTAAFDGSYDPAWNDVSQPGTTQKLDGIGGVIMYRAQWKTWAGYNSVVLNWGVRISGTQRSIKWCELRQDQTTGVWSMYQEGIYTPDADTRWMGGIAMDNNGSIALVYMKSNATTTFPGIYYTGRRTCDPLGTLPVTETIAIAGTGSQTGINRDGDYSQTVLDPDGITFWNTSEYMGGPTGANAARTRIFSFQIAPCAIAPPVANFTGAPTTICAGQSVTYTDLSTNTPTSWAWTFPGGTPATSTAQNPTVVYNTAGTYSATLIATNAGGSNTFTRTNYITVNAVPATPTAGSNSPVCAGSAINLTTPAVAGATYSWTGPSAFASAVQNPTRPAATAAMAGTYSVTVTSGGCTSAAGTTTVVVNPIPATPTAGSNSPVCAGAAINLTTPAVASATYSWTGPSAYTSTTQNPSIAGATAAMAGTYSVTVTQSGCTSAAGTTAVVVNPLPTTPTAGSNSPVCAGSAINLTTPAAAGATYSWTGPSAFTSTAQNPSIASATAAMAGTYSVTITQSGCTSAAGTTAVVVNPVPATPTAGSNSPVCAGSAINLATTAVAGATYSWTGPSAFTSTAQNPSIAGATAAMAGTYSVTITQGGCTSAAGTTAVVVNPVPATPTAGSNSPVCAGSAINLTTPAVAGATYSWTGPSAFASAVQNPTRPAATAAMAGTYSVTVTSGGCTSAAGTTTVVVNPAPATPTAGSNSPVCAGSAINLTTPAVAGATYSWTGPSAFASAVQNPTRPAATAAMAGTYSVTVTQAGCTSAAGTTTVVVNPVPATPTAGSNSPVCSGSPINLTTPAVAGATYSWTGPSAYTSTTQNPSIAGATAAMAGTYSVTVTQSGCTSAAGTTTVTVNGSITPSVSIAASPGSTICSGTNVTFTATPTNGGATPSYQWQLNGAPVGTNSATYSNAGLANSDVVTVVMTSSSSCASPTTATSNSITMTVNPAPATPTAGSNSPVCAGSAINLTTPAVAGATYSWTGPSAFASAVQNPTRPAATAAMAGTYSITVTQAGCTSAAGTTTVVVNPIPATPTAGSNSPVCSGSPINLTTPAVAGATYSWTGPFIFSSTVQNPTRPSASAAMAGTYSVTVTSGGCTSAAGTTTVVVNPVPATPTAGSNSPVCSGSAINLTTPAVAGATYSWTGPSAYTSTTQNPSIAGATAAMAGTYSVTVTQSGCTSAAGTTTVTVNGSITPSVSIAASPGSTICSGTNVTFTATPTNGGATPSYQWQLNGGPVGTNSATYSNAGLANSDVVTVVMTSSSSCASPTTATSNAITMTVNPVPATPTAGSNSPVCAGSAINLTTPAVAGATYSWTGPSAFASAVQNPIRPAATVAMAGTYSVTVTSGGCTSAAGTTTVVVNPVPATPTAGSNSPVCSGSTINLTTPAVAGATYSWTGPSAYTSTTQNPSIAGATAAMAGTYSVTVTQSGCTSAAGTTTVTVNGSITPSVSIAASPGSTICSGTNVTFTATPTNGGATPSYQWQLNGAPVGTNSATYSNAGLANSDVVTVVMTSSSSCASPTTATSNAITMTVTGTLTPSVSIAASPGSTICSGTNVTFTATPTNGGATPSYQWQLNGAPVGTNSATYSNSGLANSDVVTVVMTSSSSCASPTTATSNSITMTISGTLTPSVSIAASPGSTVCSGTNVTFTATPTNGGATPSYQWQLNGAPVGTNSATYSNAGLANSDVVTVVMTSSSSCASPATATSNAITMTVTGSSTPSVSIAASPGSTICAGTNVTFTATPANGGTTPTYQWMLNGAPVGTNSSTYSNAGLVNGDTVTLMMTSNAACVSTTTATSNPVTITVSSITLLMSSTPVSCFGDNSGSATASASGGSGTYTYVWSPVNSATATASSLTAGSYSVTVSDNSGCSLSASVTVTEPSAIALTASATTTACGTSNGTATVIASGGTAPYTYLWNDGAAQTTSTATGLTSGLYTVVVSDANNCSKSISVYVNNVTTMALTVDITEVSCNRGTDGTATVNITGGNAPFTYLWSPSSQTAATATGLSAGTYTVTVTDNGGCTAMVSVIVTEPSAIAITSSQTNTTCENSNGSITLAVSGGTAPYAYQWSNGETTSMLNSIMAGNFIVTVKDANMCSTSDTIVVMDVLTENCLFIPNSFSPNDDGDHDLWVMKDITIYSGVKVEVYNRWGNVVYTSNDYKNDWDGKRNGSALPGGVYFYIIDLHNGQKALTGSVTIIR